MKRSALIGWILAALLAIGGVAAVVWAWQERTSVEQRLVSTEEELEERRDELRQVRNEREEAEEKVEDLDEGLLSCVEDMRTQVRDVNQFLKDLRAATFGALAGLQNDLQDMIDRAETELRCGVGGTDTV